MTAGRSSSRSPSSDDMPLDAHLRKALRHAPDSDALPPAALSDAIRAAASRAIGGAAEMPEMTATLAKPAPWHRRWTARVTGWLDGLQRPAVAAAFASLVLATTLVVTWRGQPLPGVVDEAPMMTPADEPAQPSAARLPQPSSPPPEIRQETESNAQRKELAATPRVEPTHARSPARSPAPSPAPSPSPARAAPAEAAEAQTAPPQPAPAAAMGPAERTARPAPAPAPESAPPIAAAGQDLALTPATAPAVSGIGQAVSPTIVAAASPFADPLASAVARAKNLGTGPRTISHTAARTMADARAARAETSTANPATAASLAWLPALRDATRGRWQVADTTIAPVHTVTGEDGQPLGRVEVRATEVLWQSSEGGPVWRTSLPAVDAARLARQVEPGAALRARLRGAAASASAAASDAAPGATSSNAP